MTTQDKINEIMRLLDRAQQLLDEAYADHSEKSLDMVDSDNPHVGSDVNRFFEMAGLSIEEAQNVSGAIKMDVGGVDEPDAMRPLKG